jgi:hypothetical protein
MVRLPELLPENSRQALLLVSTMLMIATLKGSLDDKGKHMAEHFNDLAAKAHKEFNDMFDRIVAMDAGDAPNPVPLDESQVIVALQLELWPIQQQIVQAKSRLEDANPLLPQLNRLIRKVKAGGRARRRVEQTAAVGGKDTNQEAVLSMKFSEEALTRASGFIVRTDELGPQESAVFLIDFAKLGQVAEPMLAAYLILSRLSQEATDSMILVYFLGSFDELKVPPPAQIAIYQDSSVSRKITSVLFIEPNERFVAFLKANPRLIERPNRFCFVKDLSELSEKAGPVVKFLPQSALESLTKPDSAVKATVNGSDKTVRLHQRSIQFVGNPEPIGGVDVSPITVIMAKCISRIEKPRGGTASSSSFTITRKDGAQYDISTSKSTYLYEGITSLTGRSKTLGSIQQRVKIEQSTLQWLMVNLAFINMVNERVEPVVRKSALDLLYAVYASFNFVHEIQITKVPIEILPENLLGFVVSLSEDLAEHNPESYDGFISEFFKAYKYTERTCKSAMLCFLRPWIKHWSADIDSHPEYIDLLVKSYKEFPYEGHTFRVNIWSELARERKAIIAVNRHILESQDSQFIGVVSSFALIAPDVVTRFWVDEAANGQKVVFCLKVLAALLASHGFDFEHCICAVIHLLIVMRIKFEENTLQKCADVVHNVFHALGRVNGLAVQIDYAAAAIAFQSNASLAEFANNGKKRPWLESCRTFAKALRAAITNVEHLRVMFELCKADVDADDIALQSVSAIFSVTFASSSDADSFARDLLEILRTRKTPQVVAAIAFAIASLPMGKALASKMFFVGICLTLFLRDGTTLPLLAAAIRQFGSDPDVCQAVQAELVEYIATCSGLDIAHDATFSALLLMAVDMTADDEAAITEFLASGTTDPLAKVFSLVTKGDALAELREFDFQAKVANVGVAVLSVLRVLPKPDLVQFAISLFARKPPVFTDIPILGGEFGVELVKSVNDSTFTAEIARIAADKGEKKAAYRLSHVLMPVLVPGAEVVKLSADQLDFVLMAFLR